MLASNLCVDKVSMLWFKGALKQLQGLVASVSFFTGRGCWARGSFTLPGSWSVLGCKATQKPRTVCKGAETSHLPWPMAEAVQADTYSRDAGRDAALQRPPPKQGSQLTDGLEYICWVDQQVWVGVLALPLTCYFVTGSFLSQTFCRRSVILPRWIKVVGGRKHLEDCNRPFLLGKRSGQC